MKLKEMKIGQVYTEFFMIFEKKILKTKTDKNYLTLLIGDSSQKVSCKIWDNIETVEFNEGDIIKAEVEVITWNDNKELKIKKYRLIKEEEKSTLENDKFIASISNEKKEEFLLYINSQISNIKNENYQKLLKAIFGDKEIYNKFITCPAAVFHHENYIGGLLKHTFHVLKNSICLSESYPFLNKDLLIISCILHDIGKIDNYEYKTNIKVSRQGNFLEHISIGILIISDKINKIENFSDLDKEKLLSCILSSHGKAEWGSPIQPRTIEALLLHHSDLIDSQIYYFINEFQQNPDKDFVWSKELNTHIYTKIN